jgi:hypothetical protein
LPFEMWVPPILSWLRYGAAVVVGGVNTGSCFITKSWLANILRKDRRVWNMIELWGLKWIHPPQDRVQGRSFGIRCIEPSGFTTKKEDAQVICRGRVYINLKRYATCAASFTFRLSSCPSMWRVPTQEWRPKTVIVAVLQQFDRDFNYLWSNNYIPNWIYFPTLKVLNYILILYVTASVV